MIKIEREKSITPSKKKDAQQAKVAMVVSAMRVKMPPRLVATFFGLV